MKKIWLIGWCWLGLSGFLSANVIRIWSTQSVNQQLQVQLGDTVYLAVLAGLDHQVYNGISCYIRYNAMIFEPLDQYPAKVDMQPFHTQDFFSEGEILSNKVILPGIMAYSEGHLTHTVTNDTSVLCTFSLRVKNKTVKCSAVAFDVEPVYLTLASTQAGNTIVFQQKDSLNLVIRPSTPPGFTGMDVPADHGGRVRLSWLLSDDAVLRPGYIEGYRIYRKKLPDGIFRMRVEVGASITSWIDSVDISRISDTVFYDYYSVAYNEYGESLPSPIMRFFGLDNYPSGFDLIEPPDRMIIQSSLPVLFRWQSSLDPDRQVLNYKFMIALDSLFLQPVYQPLVPDTMTWYTPLALENSTFYWKIMVIDQEQLSVPSQSWRRFYLNQIPEAPSSSQLIFPCFPTIVTDSLPVFRWSQAIDPDPLDSVFYRLEISDLSDFSYPLHYAEITDTFYQLFQKLTDDRKYYWRLIAYNHSGLESSSPVDSFYLNYRLFTPSVFQITYPQNKQVFNQTGFILQFTPSIDEDLFDTVSYHIYYSRNPSFQPMDSLRTYSIRQEFSGLQDNSIYYFRVVARDRFGLERVAIPETLQVIIDRFNLSPTIFYLLAPDSAEAFREGEVLLRWNHAVDPDPMDTVKYRVLLGSTPNQLNLYTSSILDSFFVIPVSSLMEDQKYYWTVQAVDRDGLTRTALQTGWYFYKNTGNNAPGSFKLLTPTNFSVVTDLHPLFTWSKSLDPDPGDVVNYTFYLKDSLNLTILDSISQIKDTSLIYQKNTILENRLYSWDVAAQDRSGIVNYAGQAYYFFTNSQNESPGSFNLIAPSNDLILKNESQIFRWNRSHDPDPGDSVFYQLQFSLSPYFASSWDTTIMDTSLTVTASHFVSDTSYYWKVIALDRLHSRRESAQINCFLIDSRDPSYSIQLTQNRNFPLYLKIFILANEELSTSPQVILNGKSGSVQTTDQTRNIYFTSIHLDTTGIQTIHVRISAKDRVGNLGIMDQDVLIYSGSIPRFKWTSHESEWQGGENGFYILSENNSLSQDYFFSIYPLQEQASLQLELVTPYQVYCQSFPLLSVSCEGVLKKYSLEHSGEYRLVKEHTPDQLALAQCIIAFPNPFNDKLEVILYPRNDSPLEVVVYNLIGEKIKSLFHGVPTFPCQIIRWNPADQGQGSGVYLIGMIRDGRIGEIKKVLYMK